jgi:hypothetical protein
MNDNEPTNPGGHRRRPPWNKGKLVGPKPPLRPSHVPRPLPSETHHQAGAAESASRYPVWPALVMGRVI